MNTKSHPHRRTALRVVLMTAVLLSLSAAASAERVLRVATGAGLSGLDPIWTTAYITRNHGYMIFDTLFALDEQFEIQPQMVDTWQVSEDGLVYTLTLREGLAWHDGDPVIPADCIASIKRWGKRDPLGRRLMTYVDTFKVVDDRTFTIGLTRPYARVIASLAKLDSNAPFMMKREHAETAKKKALTEMVGSGPFRFVARSWKPGKRAVYTRNPAYVPRDEPASGAAGGKVARTDRVEWIYYKNWKTARKALTSGKVDIWESPPPNAIQQLERNDSIEVKTLDPVGSQGWVRMNHLRPPFNDPKVRLAFLTAIDQREYLEEIVGPTGQYETCPSFFTCSGKPVLDGSEPLASGTMEQAKALLAASSYDGKSVLLLNPKDFHHLAAASKITAKTLRRLGMKVKVKNVNWGTLAKRRANRGRKGGWHLFPTALNGLAAASPLTNIGIRTGEDAWFGWPTDKTVPGLIEAYAQAPDAAAEREALARLHARLFEVVPYINFGQWSSPVAYRKNVSGLLTSPVPFYWNVTKED